MVLSQKIIAALLIMKPKLLLGLALVLSGGMNGLVKFQIRVTNLLQIPPSLFEVDWEY
jgi:hypothetical protein